MKTTTFFALFLLVGCVQFREPVSKTQPENNKAYTVEFLFEHEGCKVYRFRDRGTDVYYTNCQGETINYPDSAAVIRNRTIIKN